MSFATEGMSLEQMVFDGFFEKLRKTLTPADVAAGCFSKKIITSEECEEVEKLGLTRPSQEAIAALLRAVGRSMVIKPDTTFSTFLDVLSTEEKYDPLVKEIRKKFSETSTSSIASTRSSRQTFNCLGFTQKWFPLLLGTYFLGTCIAGIAILVDYAWWRSEAAVPLGVSRYANHLIAIYNKNQATVEWPNVQISYVNLAIVESMIKDFTQKEEDDCILAMMQSNIEEVQKHKKPLNISQVVGLLENGERSQASCIIVEGIPGIGKSTFSYHLAVSWAKGEILQSYHLVVLLRLRDERMQKAEYVTDLIYHIDKSLITVVVDWITSNEGDGVMLILDGYDELSPKMQTSSIFAEIIKGNVLPKMTVLVTSRPSAKKSILKLAPQNSQYIQLIGFGKKEIQQYINSIFNHSEVLRVQLNTYLEHYPHIYGLMYVPLNCAIVVQILRDQMSSKSQPPQTYTEVYQVLIKILLKRHQEKPVKSAEKPNTISVQPSERPLKFHWLDDVSDETISQLLLLAKLAYDGIREDQLIFHGWNDVETLGLLQKVPDLYLESSGSKFSYHFIHKTVQEFMAALYVSSLPPGERAEFIRTPYWESNMIMVKRFMAGLTKFQSQDDIRTIQAFKELGFQGDGIRLLEILHWLFEAHDPDLVKRSLGDSRRGWELKLNHNTFNPFDCYVLGYCIANSRHGGWSLQLHDCSIIKECMKMLNETAFDYIMDIDLNNSTELEDEGASILATKIRNSKVLNRLHLMNCGLGPNGLRNVCSAIGNNTTLTSLDLSLNTFDEESIASLGTRLRDNKVLKSLKLQKCGLSPVSICELCDAISMNTTLTLLDLAMNMFDNKSMTCLVNLLTSNQTLQHLILVRCGLDDAAIYSLVKGLRNSTLWSLNLWDNTFTISGANELCLVMKGHPTLVKSNVKMPSHFMRLWISDDCGGTPYFLQHLI